MLRRIFDWWPLAAFLLAVALYLAMEVASIRYFGPIEPRDRIYDPEQAVEILKEFGLRK